MTALWRVLIDGRARLARGGPDEGPQELLDTTDDVGQLLARLGGLDAALAGPGAGGVPASALVMAPVDDQPVWAAGVTYERSRTARKEESTQGDVYDRVYDAERPELFLKATPGTVVGTHDDIGIRADSTWDVPEPELGLVLDAAGEVVAHCLGNDVSSRSIEGENPLYLPQAKVYDLSCAIGPCLVPASTWSPGPGTQIELAIHRDGSVLYSDEVALSTMRRSHEDLRAWLFRAATFPRGVVLLTGTSIVPGPDVTLRAGDDVVIRADGLGELRNRVRTVGTARASTSTRRPASAHAHFDRGLEAAARAISPGWPWPAPSPLAQDSASDLPPDRRDMLGSANGIAFLPSTDLHRSRQFFERELGLSVEALDDYACVLHAGSTTLRVTRVEHLLPQPFTVFGWFVTDIRSIVDDLATSGITCLDYDGLDQDPAGIWTTPGGDQIAWFTDPDGNVLSLTQLRPPQ